MRADNLQLRLFRVQMAVSDTLLKNLEDSWRISALEKANTFSVAGFQFRQWLQKILIVPAGIVEANWGETFTEAWMDKENLASFLKIRVTAVDDTYRVERLHPICFFDGMVSPIVGFENGELLWYQGGTNVSRPSDYDMLVESMMRRCRMS